MSSHEEQLELMKNKVKEMEEEASKLKELQASMEKELADSSSGGAPGNSEKELVDSRSVHVGNVDYSATPEDLSNHFASCGVINRVTILCDKFSGHPKGFAYVEFADEAAANNSLALNESLFKGRLIKVSSKRTNIPGYYYQGYRGGYGGGGGGGYRGGRGRGGGFRGGFHRGGFHRGGFRGGRSRQAPY